MLFHVVFETSKNSFSCQFTEGYYFESKSCLIKYGILNVSNQNCDIINETRNSSNSTLTDAVTVLLPTLPQALSESELCFIIIGKTANFTIAVEGTFSGKGKRMGLCVRERMSMNDRVRMEEKKGLKERNRTN